MSSYRRKRSLNFQKDDALHAIGHKIEDLKVPQTAAQQTQTSDLELTKNLDKLKESLFIDLVVQAHKLGQY